MRIFLFCLSLCFTLFLSAQHAYMGDLGAPDEDEQTWVDDTYDNLSEDQRIGQLFMIRAHSDKGRDHIAEVEQQIRDYQVGGLCFFQGDPAGQLRLVNRYQNISTLPLLVSQDAEWGLGMRLSGTMSFPKQLALGAIRRDELIYEMGAEVARQLRRVGVNTSFSPVLDVNNNPNNPIINTRSFGENRYQVAAKGYNYMRGLQDHGVMACAKHFPGHGDTDRDSHSELPIIRHDLSRLDSIELYPFEALIRYGIGSFMIAHLNVPQLDERENRPTTLSRPVVTDLLRNRLKFDGLIYTDAMEMEGVRKFFPPGEAEAEALLAGNDVILLPVDLGAAVDAVKAYLADGRLSEEQLAASVKRVLLAKYRLGLTNYESQSVAGVETDVNSPEATNLKTRLFEAALTLVRDEHGVLPLDPTSFDKLAYLDISNAGETAFYSGLSHFTHIERLPVASRPTPGQSNQLLEQIEPDQIVIVPITNASSNYQERIELTEELQTLLAQIDAHARLVVVHFGNPYDLRLHDPLKTVLCAYTADELMQDVAAQALFGITRIDGRLPITASERAAYNMGIDLAPSLRLGYAPPSQVGMDMDSLEMLMDEVADEAMRARATPGMSVLVARHGRIVFEKAYGHHTYNRRRRVQTTDLYDLASVTKVASTTLAIMHLYDLGKIDLDAPLVTYLPELEGSNKADRKLRDMLAHHAGLRSWIPFYDSTLIKTNNSFSRDPQWYRSQADETFSVPVTERLYMHRDYIDSMWQKIRESPLPNLNQYYYSDLGFYLMAALVERLSGKPLDVYVREHFYEPMGLDELLYRPLDRFPLSRIAPTERDDYFRTQLVHGYVHDMGAAMLGGVSGHAGLFGNAQDLAVVFQMLLQGGYYGGRQYLSAETVSLFTRRYPGESRRGLGFDMKQLNPDRNMNMSPLASERAFGHLGFTGTCAWADPEEELVFIFLSNRTYPSMRNNALGRLDTRPKAFSVAYRGIVD
ncbi:MAG: glycoside hydrolase family 3 N-terminal domain-containing protein [Bacteroidota bacterium]